MEHTLTEGRVSTALLRFALPLFALSLVQLLYATVDALCAGSLLGTDALAAIGAASFVVVLWISFFSGLALGANVAVASYFGARNHAGISANIHTSLIVSLIISACIGLVGSIMAFPLMQSQNVPEEILQSTATYVQIYFLSLPFYALFDMGAGIMRGLGNSKIPLYIQGIGGVLNVGLNLAFLCLLHSDVKGIAWSTLIAQGIVCVLMLLCLTRLHTDYALRLRKLRIDAHECKHILSIGLPSAVQGALITFSNAFIQSIINTLGTHEIAAFTAYFKIEILCYGPLIALSQALSVFTAQNLGAAQYARVKQGLRVACALGGGLSILFPGALYLFADTVVGLFTHDADVIAITVSIMRAVFPLYFIYAFVEVFVGICRGGKKTLYAMLVILSCFVGGRCALLLFTPLTTLGAPGVGYVFPITWSAVLILMLAYYYFVFRKRVLCANR